MEKWEEELAAKIQKRDDRWKALTGAVYGLFEDDLISHGPVSPSAMEKFTNSVDRVLSKETLVEGKIEALKDIRKIFRERRHIDHFLYVAGINKERPVKVSAQIMNIFM